MTISQGSCCASSCTRKRAVVRMQTTYPRRQLGDRACIHKNIVSRRQPLRPRRLLRDDGPHLVSWQATRRDDPLNLDQCGTVDHQDAVHACNPVPGFHQERHGENDIGRRHSAGRLRFGVPANQRVQDGFESLAFGRIAKHLLPHSGTIERPGRIDEGVTKCAPDRLDRNAVGLCELMRNGIGVNNGRALRCEQIRNDGLAAADSAGQADAKAAAFSSRGFGARGRRHRAAR